MGKGKALGGKDNKILALLAIAVCIISVAPIFLHHSHESTHHDPHQNVLKGSLDNFVVNKKTVTTKKNYASGRDVAADQNENVIITKAKTEKDSQINNVDPAVKTKSNTSPGGEGGSINNSIDAANAEDINNPNTADKKEETTNVKNETNKSYLRQKAKPSVGGNSNNTIEHELHPVANLNCADHGGPFDPHIIDEMVYWVRNYSCMLIAQ